MKKYISIILITLAVAGGSCKKTYLSELALNPNTPAVTTPGLQLTGALTKTASNTSGTQYVQYLCWAGFMAYNTGTQPSSSLLLYSITASTYDLFTPIYSNIANYNAILTTTNEPYYQAIAKIMIAYNFEQLVDNYGNVPYFQTLQGTANLTPVYDDASVIYDDLLKQLDAAIKLIQTAPATAAFPGKFDVVYSAGTAAAMNKWAIAANTLKLRLAVRQSSKASLFAAKKAALTANLAATASVGYITTASEWAVNPGYTNTDVLQPPLDVAYGYKASGAVSGSGATYQANTYVVNFLIGSGTNTAPTDPRLFQIYAPSTSAKAAGSVQSTALGQTTPPRIPVGSALASDNVTPSKFSAFVLSPTKSSPLLAAAESYFLQAEAMNNGLIPGSAATAYNAGVTASFTELGLTVAQANAYLALPAYAYPVAGTPLQQETAIITQKWVSLDPYAPLEAFTEIRRTRIPAVPLSILAGVTATDYVERLPYPTVEFNNNAANVAGQPNDIYTTKIFWEN